MRSTTARGKPLPSCRTGELRPYGNLLLVKGVVNRYVPA